MSWPGLIVINALQRPVIGGPMRISRSNLAVSATALAVAGVLGGVTAISLLGQQPDRDQTTVVRNVSDAGAEATPSGQASAPAAAPSATASAAAAAADPAQMSSTTNGSQTVTEPAPTTEPAPVEPAPVEPAPVEPAPTTDPAPAEPTWEPAPPANSGGESGPPVGAGPPPGPGFQCLPQEYGINPRCPAPSPTS